MINGLEGIPGSGKSFEAVVFHVLAALRSGRKVITNLPLFVDQFAAIDPVYRELIDVRTQSAPIRGTWDAYRVDDKGNGLAFELFADGHEERAEGVNLFGSVWDYYDTWKHPVSGQGALFVVDECHVGMPKIGTAKPVIEWYKLHRHFNQDVLLMTQRFRDMNAEISGLLAMLVKVRKADIMGRADHYIRKVHGGYRGAVISTEQRKYQPQYFCLYKSHTQGNSVAESLASDVSPFIVKFRRFTWGWIAMTACACVYLLWPSAKPAKPAPPPVKPLAAASARPQVAAYAPQPARVVPPAEAAADPAPSDPFPEPYAAHKLHVTGHMAMTGREIHTFAVVLGTAVLATVTTRDLERAGYKVQPLSDCAVVLSFNGRQRSVVCDLPAAPLFDGNRSVSKL